MSTPEELLDYALDVAESKHTSGAPVEWEMAFEGKTVEAIKAVLGRIPKDERTKITPVEFRAAWRRAHPRDKCEHCDDTGQLWDGEQYAFCECDKGRHMAELNARILSESVALNPVWARGTTEGVRRQGGNVVTLERLCGQCGSPLNEHTETDRKFCDTLSPKGADR